MGEHPASEERPVAVVRVQRSLRLLALVVLGGLSFGIASSVVSALVAGDPGAPWGRQGWSAPVVVGWLVAGALFLVMVLALAALLSYRVTWSPDGVSTRLLVLGWSVPLHDVAGVVAVAPSTRSVTGPRPPGVVAVHRTGRVVATLRPTETGWSRGLEVLRSWGRTRPELVGDEATAVLLGLPVHR